jgi:hypothetical protein
MDATMTYRNVEYHPRRNLVPLMVLMAVLMITVAYGAHALEKHGSDAQAVRQCMENNDPLEMWTKMTDGRVFWVCLLDDGRFGIMITDGNKEVTSFVYRASKGLKVKLSQVEFYLRNNVGALRVK